MVSQTARLASTIAAGANTNDVVKLFDAYPTGKFQSDDQKFLIISEVSQQTGLRITHKMLNEIESVDQLKTQVMALAQKRTITPGNPLEELFDMKKPPPNLRIVLYRRKDAGGPIAMIA